MQTKPRVIKDFEKLDQDVQEQIKLAYPFGFTKHLIRFTNREGKIISALPFEVEDKYYLARMTPQEAKDIILHDDDYDEEGNLKDEIMEGYQEKYTDTDEGEDDDDF